MHSKIKQIPYLGLLLLLAYMPFHIFLSQSVSLLTGGLSVWKIWKDVFALILVIFTTIVVWTYRKQNKFFNRLVVISLIYAALYLLIWAINPHIYKETALLGMVYSNRLLWYLVIGLGAGLLLGKKISQNFLIKLALVLSTIVCVLGIIQYFLPTDFLAHFGYSLARGARPSFQIDSKAGFTRIMSTVRDPNSLGAYLILPITFLSYYLFSGAKKHRTLAVVLLCLHVAALILTFSRSALAGAILSVLVLAWIRWRRELWSFTKKYWPAFAVTIVLLAGGAFVFRHKYAVQNLIEHSSKRTTQAGSDTLHVRRIYHGLQKIAEKPVGHGPGTAGIVSIKNPYGGFLPENYYIQVGYEIGVVGLAFFIFINVFVYMKLHRRISPLTLCLVASFWGYILVNMLLQIWSNEAVAAQWWLLAGVALASPAAEKLAVSKKSSKLSA